MREIERDFLNQKKEETKKGLYKPTRNSTFKLSRKKIKKSLYRPAKKKSL